MDTSAEPEHHPEGFSGAALREARRERGWGQARLASEAGVSQSWISKLERGESIPAIEALKAMARIFDREEWLGDPAPIAPLPGTEPAQSNPVRCCDCGAEDTSVVDSRRRPEHLRRRRRCKRCGARWTTHEVRVPGRLTPKEAARARDARRRLHFALEAARHLTEELEGILCGEGVDL